MSAVFEFRRMLSSSCPGRICSCPSIMKMSRKVLTRAIPEERENGIASRDKGGLFSRYKTPFVVGRFQGRSKLPF